VKKGEIKMAYDNDEFDDFMDGDFYNVTLHSYEELAMEFLESKYPDSKFSCEMAIECFDDQRERWRMLAEIPSKKHSILVEGKSFFEIFVNMFKNMYEYRKSDK
jgi:hypothetical protein